MKRKAVLLGIAGLLLVGIASWTVADSATQKSEVYIGRGYVVAGVALNEGKYIVTHDDAACLKGEPCTSFFKAPQRGGQEAVAKAHCAMENGAKVEGFTLRSTSQPDGTSLVKSIQFPGSTVIHNLPTGS
jgi:hypothetical protein